MSLEVVTSAQYRKSLKRIKKRGIDLTPLNAIVNLLSSRNLTSEEIHEYRDHPLNGQYKGYRGIHIGGTKSDWALIYKKRGDTVTLEITELYLLDTGTHVDLNIDESVSISDGLIFI